METGDIPIYAKGGAISSEKLGGFYIEGDDGPELVQGIDPKIEQIAKEISEMLKDKRNGKIQEAIWTQKPL